MIEEKVHTIAVGVSAMDTVRRQLISDIYCRTLKSDNEMHKPFMKTQEQTIAT
jgi:hypothetical protein